MPHQNFASIPPKVAGKFLDKIGGKIFKILYATSNTAHENNIVNWHSECTNSFDMFVFLLFFPYFLSADSISSTLLVSFFLPSVCSFEGTYNKVNGCWYTVTGPDVCIPYSKIH